MKCLDSTLSHYLKNVKMWNENVLNVSYITRAQFVLLVRDGSRAQSKWTFLILITDTTYISHPHP